MAKKIPHHQWQAALAELLAGSTDLDQTALAVRGMLQDFALRFPGNAVELRVPPFAAVQCIEGPSHSRGTPPNVVEMSPDTLIDLAIGKQSWKSLIQQGQISASGGRSDLGEHFPLFSDAEIGRIQKNHQAE